jgi:RNA polymerase sigma-70 factor, ECF subfamily
VKRPAPPAEPAPSGSAPRPDREAERALHARLLAGDVVASADLAEAYLPPLVARLARAFPHLDGDVVETIATDVVLATAEHSERYQPDRGPLGAYLLMAARGDLRNAFQSAARRRAREVVVGPVELAAAERNLVRDDADLADVLAGHEPLDPALLALLAETFDDQERRVVELVMDGERDTDVYARLLELDHLPPGERRREVKRVKDRLQKRLRRLAPRIQRDG